MNRTATSPIAVGWQVNRCLWAAVGGSAIYLIWLAQTGNVRVAPNVALALIFVGAGNAALRTYSGWRRGGFNDRRASWIFNLVDVGILSLAVYATGGARSEFWLLYLVLVVAESTTSTPHDLVWLLGITCGSYGAAVSADGLSSEVWLSWTPRVFVLMIVAAFARGLASIQTGKQAEVSRLRAEMAAVNERGRIAREMHDGLGHQLVGSLVRLELARKLVEKDPSRASQILESEVPALRKAWGEGRDAAFNLRAWEPNPGGLAEAVRESVDLFAKRANLEIDLRVQGKIPVFSSPHQLDILRILQEALTNVARHSGATSAVVELASEGLKLMVSVTDNGSGMDALALQSGMGLRSMRERAERLGGTVEIRAASDGGCCLELAMPLNSREDT